MLDRLIDQELLGEQMKSALIKHASEEEAAAQVSWTVLFMLPEPPKRALHTTGRANS